MEPLVLSRTFRILASSLLIGNYDSTVKDTTDTKKSASYLPLK